MPPFIRFTPAKVDLTRLLYARLDRAIARIHREAEIWGQEWKSAVERVTPVREGHLRREWFVIVTRSGDLITIILANHLQYGEWLEIGTEHIAHGQVLAWTYGQPPVMEWPAKSSNLPKHDTSSRFMTAMTPGSGEQMPMVRPVGFNLVAKLIERIQRVFYEELSRP